MVLSHGEERGTGVDGDPVARFARQRVAGRVGAGDETVGSLAAGFDVGLEVGENPLSVSGCMAAKDSELCRDQLPGRGSDDGQPGCVAELFVVAQGYAGGYRLGTVVMARNGRGTRIVGGQELRYGEGDVEGEAEARVEAETQG